MNFLSYPAYLGKINYLGAEPTRYQIILQHFLIIYEFFVACPPFHEVIPSGEGDNLPVPKGQ